MVRWRSIARRRRARRGGERRGHRLAAALAAGVTFFGLAGTAPARATDSAAVAAFGLFGAEGGENRAAIFELEYRLPGGRWEIGPVLAAAMTSDGGLFVRAGVGRDFPFAGRWNLHVTATAGYYEPGHGKYLGAAWQFRSAAELGYELKPGVRLGAAFAHISNGGLGDNNPGMETVAVTFALAPGRLRPR